MGQGLGAVFPIVVIRVITNLLMHSPLRIKVMRVVVGAVGHGARDVSSFSLMNGGKKASSCFMKMHQRP